MTGKFKICALLLLAGFLFASANVADAAAKNLGMTVSQFIQKYNATVGSHGLDSIKIGATKNKSGAVLSTFQYAFTPNVGIIGSVGTADGLLREVCVLSSPQSENEGLMAMAAFTGISLTVNPEMTSAQRDNLWQQLKLYDIEKLLEGDGVAIAGNVKYTTQLVGNVFSFIASAKDL